MQSPVEHTSISASPQCPAALCRQFWKAGNYNAFASKFRVPSSKNYLHIHPKFLHSNATSHKWAFGAVAELLDNAIDEIQNGATFVTVDKIYNPRDKSPALLIRDDGGGMDPVVIRHCMSFGFSDKTSKSAIGRYGNGFKTGSMRLGADVIVFTRRMDDRRLTQSIGLLSYTYLSCTGLDRIVVPIIDYEYVMSTGTFKALDHNGQENFQSNVSIISQWSPYSTEAELLKQFDDIGYHGTKVIIYNLWFTDDGTLELIFDSDPEDIRLQGSNETAKIKPKMLIREEPIGNQYRYSLRVYLSILYLRLPQNFSIILRGKVVEHHSIARDLKFPELIVYRPHTGEGEIITTIGFLKEAPEINIHGFNIYHKNRLILRIFWIGDRFQNRRLYSLIEGVRLRTSDSPYPALAEASSSEALGRFGKFSAVITLEEEGLLGSWKQTLLSLLNKQDFERTSLFQRLETRLKDMTSEYWDHHCGLIGCLPRKKTRIPASSLDSSNDGSKSAELEPSGLNNFLNTCQTDKGSLPAGSVIETCQANTQQCGTKRAQDLLLSALTRRRQIRSATYATNQRNEQEAALLMQANKKLRAKCLEIEKREEELFCKVLHLKSQLEEARNMYGRMSTELLKLEVV